MIFVDKENKELLEQHLDGFATWMPYGFGEKGMLGLYPTNDHSEDEIIMKLKKYNIPYYTEATEAVVLDESGNDSADEAYKGIFIDRKTGDFKILTGRFPDKKAMINKYGTLGKDYIARKVFEKPVFDWILNNAKSSLDSYLMFSTAFSKWKDNSILDKYYMKLINDMPQLFKNVRAQDKIGGDNKAKGSDKESVEINEASYIPNGGKKDKRLYIKTYDKDGNVLIDYGKEADIKVGYYPDIEGDLYQQPEFWQTLKKVVKDTEQDTGEDTVAYVTVYDKPENSLYGNLLAQPTRTEIMDKRHIPDVGYTSAHEYNPDDPTVRGVGIEIYCKNDKGQKIGYRNVPMTIRHNLDKDLINDEKAIIDNYEVWHTAMQSLNMAKLTGDKDLVYIVNPLTGKEMACNRMGVETNLWNMDPAREADEDYIMTNPIDKKTGKPKIDPTTGLPKEPQKRHSSWQEVKASTFSPKKDLNKQQLADLLKFMNRNKEIERRPWPSLAQKNDNDATYNLSDIDQVVHKNRKKQQYDSISDIMSDVMKKPQDTIKKIDPEKFDMWKREWVTKNATNEPEHFKEVLRNVDIRFWPKEYHDKIEQDRADADIYYDENVEQESIREEVKDLVKASGIYDLPDYQMPNTKNVVRLSVKNDLGKDDFEIVNIDTNSDKALEEIEAAARRLKDRNLGKKIFMQFNDEPEEEYGL